MPEDQGWIKLHRKVLENELWLHDDTAWKIFMYLLLRADRETGEIKTAYSTMGSFLGMQKSTLHKAIKRLKKAEMVNDSVNDKYTTFYICKWSEYQGAGERSGERKVNAKRTQSEHIQELRIKNISTNVDIIPTTNEVSAHGQHMGNTRDAPEQAPELLWWEQVTGTKIRTKLEQNIQAAHRLKNKLSPEDFKRLVETVRIIRADQFAGTFLHTIGNYVELEKKLEKVEAYRQGKQDQRTVSKSKLTNIK
jgi:hypothetical protein